tara:strand:- start:9250 stop:10011 length:762 start_codon:yes stop_codon:yes gene_type:complete
MGDINFEHIIVALCQLFGLKDDKATELQSFIIDKTNNANDNFRNNFLNLIKIMSILLKTNDNLDTIINNITKSVNENKDNSIKQGPQGTPGIQGIAGEKGEKGEQGKIGKQGPCGIPGEDALDLFESKNNTIKLKEKINCFSLESKNIIFDSNSISHCFEWYDDNTKPNIENTIGRIVYLENNGKITLSDKTINKIPLGIVSKNFIKEKQNWAAVIMRGIQPCSININDELDDRWILLDMIDERKNIRNIFIR